MIAELNARVTSQLNYLVEELTERIPARLGKEQSHSAHGEALERQRAIQRRIQYLKRVGAGLGVVAPEALVRGRVGFGSQIRIEDLHTGELLPYTIMHGDGLDFEAGEISIASPVAQALLGRAEGDEVEVVTPQRTRRFRVLSTTTLFDLLGEPDAPTVRG